ncbi:MAG: nuclear transport factor 2 family protein, partial [Steroidobacteraceae bacterium]
MATEIENFIGVYRVINELAPAVGDGRWQVFESFFTQDAAMHHPFLGELKGAKNIAAAMGGSVGDRISSHYLAGNIRIDPSSGDTAHAVWDFSIAILSPDKGKDPLLLTSGSRFTADFRHLEGRWLIADLTPIVL